MHDIVLCTLNARYWHCAFGLRYLHANLGDLQARTKILEFGINDHTIELLGLILAERPKIIGFGVYIWNIEPLTRLVAECKQVAPEMTIVLGGPEVSYEQHALPICQSADYVISGEADFEFPKLCQKILDAKIPAQPQLTVLSSSDLGAAACGEDRANHDAGKFIAAPVPPLANVQLPYDLYTDEDIAHRVVYVEVSRGCPFTCEFCLSALDIPVRLFDLDLFLAAMQRLLDRGARQFKFVDRTFNLNMRVSKSILQFFLDRYMEGMFLHFEMIPDRLPDDLKSLVAKFPDGALQFEIGVQTFNDDVGERISRRQDNQQLADNFRFLRQQTGVHIHADLIVGLPGETLESFGHGFDALVALDPQEIQVGILKRLRGTPITRHDAEWQMNYSPFPPYEILTTSEIDFPTMQRMRRFARYWDLVANSGNFTSSRDLIWDSGSPFECFLAFSDWLYATEKKTHGIPLAKLAHRVFSFLTDEVGIEPTRAAECIAADYARSGRKDKLPFLSGFDTRQRESPQRKPGKTLPRQTRHRVST